MKITVVGTGYVGLVTGACFAEMDIKVTCVDVNKHKIESLRNGVMPIYEPGLEDLVTKNVRDQRLFFSTELQNSLDDVCIIFSAVGTPPGEDGSADMQYVMEVARSVGRYAKDYFVFVNKSTVPVGTAIRVRDVIQEELNKRGLNELEFDVASNPEFLKEGSAIKDFMSPDRVVIGIDSERARDLLDKLYKPFTLNGFPIMIMDVASAEMTKYAANAMLATRISFMNEIANLCEMVGADVDMVRKGIGADIRIGSRFLYSGIGYGGSCFPKDVKALCHIGVEHDYQMQLIEAVERVNNKQKYVMFEKLKKAFAGDLRGKIVAVWGLAFKPDTDDIREAPSMVLIKELLDAGVQVRVYDPVAMSEGRKILGDRIIYCDSIYDAATGSDAVSLVTEWKQFRLPRWRIIKESMRGNIVVDGRNIYDEKELLEEGFNYYRIGKKTEK